MKTYTLNHPIKGLINYTDKKTLPLVIFDLLSISSACLYLLLLAKWQRSHTCCPINHRLRHISITRLGDWFG